MLGSHGGESTTRYDDWWIPRRYNTPLGDLQSGMLGIRIAPSSNASDLKWLDFSPHTRILRIILAAHWKCLRLILHATQWICRELLASLELLTILFRPGQEIKLLWNYPILQGPLIITGGVLITTYPSASGWNCCIWISLPLDRFADVRILFLRPLCESASQACNILCAVLGLIAVWICALQAVCRWISLIIFGWLQWIHVSTGRPPTTLSVISYDGPAAEPTVIRPTTPHAIIHSSPGNYQMFVPGVNVLSTSSGAGPMAHRPCDGKRSHSVPLLSSGRPIRRTV